MSTTATGDLQSQYQSISRSIEYYRPVANGVYTPGTVLQIVSLDLQSYPDLKTAAPSPTGGSGNSLCGVVASTWGGFNGSDPPPQYTAPANVTVGNAAGAGIRGTLDVLAVQQGPASVLVDATTGNNLADKTALVRSTTSVGYAQGVTSPVGGDTVLGLLMLPSTGIGSAITAAALVQASQTATIATPAAGDQPYLTIQTPYVNSAPGVAQTFQFLMTPGLTSAQAVSATTAATAFVAFLNAQAGFNKYFIATNSAGVVTVTVNALSAPWQVNWASNGTITGYATFGLSGQLANSLTFVAGVVGSGGTTNTAGAATFTSGAGYKGLLPARIICGFSV